MQKRLASSSILEVVIAMVVIVMVLGISLMIYSNVMRMSLSSRQLKAQFILSQAMMEVQAGQTDERMVIDDWQVKSEIKPYQQGGQLSVVHLTAFDPEEVKVAELTKILILSSSVHE